MTDTIKHPLEPLTASEVQLAVNSGWQVISLGPRTFRVETAAVAIAAWIGLLFRG